MKAGRARFAQARGVDADRGYHLGRDDVLGTWLRSLEYLASVVLRG
jgi:hypothetical protein